MTIIYIVYGYLILGFLVYLFLLTGKRLNRLDEDTSGTGLGFRLLILPGMLLFWPLILFKFFKS